MKAVFIDPATNDSTTLEVGVNVRHIGYFIDANTNMKARMIITRELMAPYVLEDMAVKWVGKNIQCMLYSVDVLSKTMEVYLERYDLQVDQLTGIMVEALFININKNI